MAIQAAAEILQQTRTARIQGGAFHNPALTVDGVVLVRRAEGTPGGPCSVLLIERGRDPFRGKFALPGGFVDYGEDIERAIHREIAEETGLTGLPFRQFHTFGRPDRDPRGHTVSVVYVAVLIGEQPVVTAGDDAAGAAWFPAPRIPAVGQVSGRADLRPACSRIW